MKSGVSCLFVDILLSASKLDGEMFQRQKNWISDVLWKPKKAHSLEQLRYVVVLLILADCYIGFPQSYDYVYFSVPLST